MMDLGAIPELSKLDARVPKWDIQALRARPCPICRQPGPPALKRPDGLPVSYCSDCALWYVSGMPPDADIYALYQDYWSDYRPKQMDGKGARVVREAAKTTASVDLKAQRLTALLGTLKGKLILEVGAGRGEFLAAVRYAGAEVIANEISPEACHFLERALRIPVVRGELAEIRWDFDPPDVIVMSDLLEHPIEPFRLLSRAVSLLRKGGQLVIWTPNGGAAGQDAATAQCWVGFRVDLEHFQYFSPKTIQVLAGTWGLQIDHLETTGYPGLSGIDKLPLKTQHRTGHKSATATKAAIKRAAPWLARVKQIANDLRRPRVRGNYHLFAILTKS
jgi:2-polyprenyl-3-methyl-5-hydroxy-6-metoxy-1,4-benzoquinol methylase